MEKAFVCIHGFGNHPEMVVRNAAGRRLGWVRFLGRFGLDRMAAHVVGFPKVEGGRLPADFSAQSFRSDRDLYAVPLAPEFHDMGELTISPPPDTHGSANHRFYWKSLEVAAAVANAGETPAAGRLAKKTSFRRQDLHDLSGVLK